LFRFAAEPRRCERRLRENKTATRLSLQRSGVGAASERRRSGVGAASERRRSGVGAASERLHLFLLHVFRPLESDGERVRDGKNAGGIRMGTGWGRKINVVFVFVVA